MSHVMDAGWRYRQPRRLLTFALDGNQKLPVGEGRFVRLQPLDDPAIKIDPAAAAAGARQYIRCMACHGRELKGAGGPGPDLRESAIAMNPDTFWSVLHQGLLVERGMPRFSRLTREDAMQIYAYIRSGARQATAAQVAAPDAAAPSLTATNPR
jgi:quinohemoprotein ethanol dehydrogenase